MPFSLSPASADDCEAIVRVQFEACAQDPGFSTIFPRGLTPEVVDHYADEYRRDICENSACNTVKVTDTDIGELACFAIWYFLPEKSQEQIGEELRVDDFHLPAQANREVGDVLVGNSVRKRHAIMGEQAYVCESAAGKVHLLRA